MALLLPARAAQLPESRLGSNSSPPNRWGINENKSNPRARILQPTWVPLPSAPARSAALPPFPTHLNFIISDLELPITCFLPT